MGEGLGAGEILLRALSPTSWRGSVAAPGSGGKTPHLKPDDRPLILTLKLDAASFARLDKLRQAHFPPERNHLAAHLTLFHKLSGERLDETISVLSTAARRSPVPLIFDGVRSLGRGAAFSVTSPQLLALRADLARAFADQLGAQDRQAFRPHVTVQNKVSPDAARDLIQTLSADPTPWGAIGEGFLLWRYLGGPWLLEAEVVFRGVSAPV